MLKKVKIYEIIKVNYGVESVAKFLFYPYEGLWFPSPSLKRVGCGGKGAK